MHSLWQDDPRPLYSAVTVPTLLMAAVDAVPRSSTPVSIRGRLTAIPDAQVQWYVGAHHDLHAQQPQRCADDLLELAARAEG